MTSVKETRVPGEPGAFQFEIRSEERDLVLRAESQRACTYWVRGLNLHMEKLLPLEPAPPSDSPTEAWARPLRSRRSPDPGDWSGDVDFRDITAAAVDDLATSFAASFFVVFLVCGPFL